MKKLIYPILGGIVLLLLFFFLNPGYGSKREALGSVGHTFVNAKFHHALIIEGGGRAFQSQHNLAVIARATKYMGTFGSGTTVYREIARIASEADQEYPRFEAVLDLAVRSISNSRRILALAESIRRIKNPEHEATWQAAYDDMLARTEYPSVEVAVASQKEHSE